ncbi:MAG: hypothetical protein ACFB0C_14330 [Leptolyngbyaceae cyanobacterium]
MTLVSSPVDVRLAIQRVMGNPGLLAQIQEDDRHRLGEAGAAERIATAIMSE